MNNRHLLCVGLGGSAIAALCCFTPLLVVILTALGVSSALGWLDFVLLPALAIFLLITVYAVWRLRRPA